MPTTRPFISLADYDSVSRTGAAYLRLKTVVDNVVNLTNALPTNATWADVEATVKNRYYEYSVTDSVIMYRLTNDAKYIQQAVRMMNIFVANENALIASNTRPTIAVSNYLYSGKVIEQLALTYDYGYSYLTATERAAIETLVNQTLFNIWNHTAARWSSTFSNTWSGWSTDDPGNNFYYSFLKGTQLWALATHGSNTTLNYRGQTMSLFSFLQSYKYPQLISYLSTMPGGGSREGTGYGNSHRSLFEDYRYWKSSTGEDLSALTAHTRESIDYWLHAMVPTRNYFASIGDQARVAVPIVHDYQRELFIGAKQLTLGTPQAARAAWWLENFPVTGGGTRWIYGKMDRNYDIRYDLLDTPVTAVAPTDLVYHATGAGALFARSSWGTDASWLSTVAGPFDQSHAHQEQGNFTFYKGTWLAATSNLWSNNGINQGVDVNNVIRFVSNGAVILQNRSTTSRSSMNYVNSGDTLQVNQDLTQAYSRNASLVSSWRRTLNYTRSTHNIQVVDTCTIASTVQPIFQVHVPELPIVNGNVATTSGLRVTVSNPGAAIASVSMPTVNAHVLRGYRLDITLPVGAPCGFDVNLQAL